MPITTRRRRVNNPQQDTDDDAAQPQHDTVDTPTASASLSSATSTTTTTTTLQNADQPVQSMTFLGKILVYIGFPLFVGIFGLYLAYLEQIKDSTRKLSFDQDFMLPFMLATAMVIVVGVQTNGFTTRQIKPLVQWPTVKRVKKIVHTTKDGRVLTQEQVEAYTKRKQQQTQTTHKSKDD